MLTKRFAVGVVALAATLGSTACSARANQPVTSAQKSADECLIGQSLDGATTEADSGGALIVRGGMGADGSEPSAIYTLQRTPSAPRTEYSPPSKNPAYTLEVVDSSGNEVARVAVPTNVRSTDAESDTTRTTPFCVAIAGELPDIAKLRLSEDDRTESELAVSPGAVDASRLDVLTSPNTLQVFGVRARVLAPGKLSITWSSRGAAGENVSYGIHYRDSDDSEWRKIVTHLTQTSATVEVAEPLPPRTRIQVVATTPTLTAAATSPPLESD